MQLYLPSVCQVYHPAGVSWIDGRREMASIFVTEKFNVSGYQAFDAFQLYQTLFCMMFIVKIASFQYGKPRSVYVKRFILWLMLQLMFEVSTVVQTHAGVHGSTSSFTTSCFTTLTARRESRAFCHCCVSWLSLMTSQASFFLRRRLAKHIAGSIFYRKFC